MKSKFESNSNDLVESHTLNFFLFYESAWNEAYKPNFFFTAPSNLPAECFEYVLISVSGMALP